MTTPASRSTRFCCLDTLLQAAIGSVLAFAWLCMLPAAGAEPAITVKEADDRVQLVTPHVEAAIAKKKFVTGVAPQSFVDRKTGFRELGYGLDIVDWLVEPGSDEAYRDQLKGDLLYNFNNSYHGKITKRSIEGPQICTRAGHLAPQVIRGKDFVAIQQSFTFNQAAPGKKAGSRWEQTLVFPADQRYFFSTEGTRQGLSQKFEGAGGFPGGVCGLTQSGGAQHAHPEQFPTMEARMREPPLPGGAG